MLKGKYKFAYKFPQLKYLCFYRTLLALGYHVSMETKEKQQQNRMKMIKLGNK